MGCFYLASSNGAVFISSSHRSVISLAASWRHGDYTQTGDYLPEALMDWIVTYITVITDAQRKTIFRRGGKVASEY